MLDYVKYSLWGLVGICSLPIIVPILLLIAIGYITERMYNSFWRCN